MTGKIGLIKKLLEDKKGEDVVILDVSNLTNLADYFVIATANSPVHAKAMANHVIEELKKHGIEPDHTEGIESANWILIDFLDTIVHIFQREWREYYDLEWLYGTAERVEA
ncbi:MAG: ribosome silencing factor [Aquificaceae bacterium]